MEYKEALREYIFDKLVDSGLTTTEFAKRVGIDRATIQKILKGKLAPKPKTMAKYFPDIERLQFSIDAPSIRKEADKSKLVVCPFNIGIDCSEPYRCNKCGWNPSVMEKRIKKYRGE